MKTELVLDALEQTLWARTGREGLIHHSDRGSQYLSIRYSEHLAEAGVDSSVGTTGDSYDNARFKSTPNKIGHKAAPALVFFILSTDLTGQ